MDVVAAYRDVGTFRGAAEVCGVDPKTVKRKVLAHAAGELDEERAGRAAVPKNTDGVRDLVAEKVAATRARVSAKRLLPVAQAAGYTGSPRNFRRLVATEKRAWRATQARHQRRPAVWVPGDTVVIDWGTLPDGIKVFCAVVAWCRFRFVRYARDETAATTMALLAECFETIGGTPAKVLADRMGCLKGGVVANVVIPTPDYVRFATHYGFRPDFCHTADPESKGIVEHLVGYAKRDIPIPAGDGIINPASHDYLIPSTGSTAPTTCVSSAPPAPAKPTTSSPSAAPPSNTATGCATSPPSNSSSSSGGPSPTTPSAGPSSRSVVTN